MAMAEASVRLLERDGLPSGFPEGAAGRGAGILSFRGCLYLSVPSGYLTAEDTPAGFAVLSSIAASASRPKGREDALRSLLEGKAPASALRSLHLNENESRCVVVLEPLRDIASPEGAVRDLAPLEEGDLLLSLSDGRACLIKSGEDADEIAEFALALTDTVEEETGLRLLAGVSSCRIGADNLFLSCREATDALETGRFFSLDGPVFVYRHLALERFIRAIPPEKREALKRELFTPQAEKALHGELEITAEAFFDSDLNLSDTARRLFVHRNTLNYRLDKIRRETGLDLRRFRDAAVFRLLMSFPSQGDPKER